MSQPIRLICDHVTHLTWLAGRAKLSEQVRHVFTKPRPLYSDLIGIVETWQNSLLYFSDSYKNISAHVQTTWWHHFLVGFRTWRMFKVHLLEGHELQLKASCDQTSWSEVCLQLIGLFYVMWINHINIWPESYWSHTGCLHGSGVVSMETWNMQNTQNTCLVKVWHHRWHHRRDPGFLRTSGSVKQRTELKRRRSKRYNKKSRRRHRYIKGLIKTQPWPTDWSTNDHLLLLLSTLRLSCCYGYLWVTFNTVPESQPLPDDVRGQRPGGCGSAGRWLGHQWAGPHWRQAPPQPPAVTAGRSRPPPSPLVQTSAQVCTAPTASLDQSQNSTGSPWQQVNYRKHSVLLTFCSSYAVFYISHLCVCVCVTCVADVAAFITSFRSFFRQQLGDSDIIVREVTLSNQTKI